MLGMTDLTADDAGKALRVIGNKLLDAGILTAEGNQALSDESFRMSKMRTQRSWTSHIARERPILFERVRDSNGDPISISLSAERIAVDQGSETCPPFLSLDIAIAITDRLGEPVSRWHLDRANAGQHGPLFHLQMGGHLPGYRDRELPIAEPRWCHPPMELGLLCEVISANFFTTQWAREIRDDPAWCQAIQKLQRLCYAAYVARLQTCLTVSDSTALAQMWNGHWH